MNHRPLFTEYLKNLTETVQRGDAREESFYPALETLLRQAAQAVGRRHIHITTLPRPTEGGNPDFRVWNGQDRITGYIEAKNPTVENLDGVEESEQLRRYRATFPNLILTNFLEFRLYRDGERADTVLLARPVVLNRIRTVPPLEKADELWALFERFLDFSLPQTFTAESLAIELAKRTRFLRNIVLEQLTHEQQSKGQLFGFYQAFQKFLIGSLNLEDFADLYAQTITYGLFAARTRAGEGFNRRVAFDNIPHTIGILRDLFRFISLGDLPVQLEWIVDDIAEVLAVADAPGILARYYRDGKGSDPIVHFYETFLAHYDPQERERRGVYYTPEPVVDFIVRSLHRLLQSHFHKPDGLAASDVTLLDPAAGTMTFVARAARQAVTEFEGKYGSGARQAFIHDHILRNFYAFELMMAPYAVGHLKMAFYLEELGRRLSADERVQFYLTNTLDDRELEQTALPGLSSLAEESHLAGEVKRRQPILVILGNPPYSGHSANQGAWIRSLIEDYKQVDGMPLGEKNPKWLQDDYVKFLRFAEWKIAQAGRGVVGMITNHSYLDNPTFRGMRRHLMQTFDEIYILDLHGNALKRETCPDGSPDQNVFDIRQGVAVAFFVKTGAQKTGPGRVYHAERWGRRDEKYAWLQAYDWSSAGWQEITPQPEFYLFIRRGEAALARYTAFPKVTDIFPVNSVGIVTARDHLTIHWTPEEVWTTVLNFSRLEAELARQAYALGKDARDWKVTLAQQDLKNSGPQRDKITPILYRPFDVRFTYYTGKSRGFHCRPRPEVMRHMLAGENVALMTCRQLSQRVWAHALVTDRITDDCMVSNRTRERGYLFPLYLYPDIQFSFLQPHTRRPNLNPDLIAALEKAWEAEFQPHPHSGGVGSPPAGRELEGGVKEVNHPQAGWQTPPELWARLKPLAREMRRNPTPEEDLLWQALRNKQLAGYKFRRQHAIDRFIVDFYCAEARLVVEVDGPIHQYHQEEDAIRQEFIESQGLHLLRFTTDQVNQNLAAVLEQISAALGKNRQSFTPEDLFHYIYAVLYAPSYREQYAEFLRIDFPRLPFPADFTLFLEMAALGRRLAQLHLLRSAELDPPLARFEGQGDNRVAKSEREGFGYDAQRQRLHINSTQFFEPVPPEVWEYPIGGYTVCQKWLKDRRGRQLSLDEIRTYCSIITALGRTIQIQASIDELYPAIEAHALKQLPK